MKQITIKSYAKINLSLDVLGMLPNGYHQVEMVMQQIRLHDLVTVRWEEEADEKKGEKENDSEEERIHITTNRSDLPLGKGNLAYRAAELMLQKYPRRGKIRIHIEKNIPVAAGLAGGSGNGAAVLHGLNCLWGTRVSLEELCHMGVALGADVPFCLMGQAKGNENLLLAEEKLACTCALAEGIGEKLTPVRPLECAILLSKPAIGVSTAEVYKGVDEELGLKKPTDDGQICIMHHINTKDIINGLNEKKYDKIIGNMANLLEIFTIKRYPIVTCTKNMIEQQGNAAKVLMSGSGPTVFAVYFDSRQAEEDFKVLCGVNEETYLTETLV